MSETVLTRVAQAIAERIGTGTTIAAGTGAGGSKESGVPTFRGKDGLWEKYRAEDVCTIHVLRRDPALFWRFHDSLRGAMLGSEPNEGHAALADMEATLGRDAEFAVITQNIDGLHQRAGSKRVVELHGDALSFQCMKCRQACDVPYPAPEYPPQCEHCGAVVRPNVTLFGEMLPTGALEDAQRLALNADVYLSIGTSVIVQPAASLPFIALEAGALVVEINPNPTPLTGAAQLTVEGTSAEVLPALWQVLRAHLDLE